LKDRPTGAGPFQEASAASAGRALDARDSAAIAPSATTSAPPRLRQADLSRRAARAGPGCTPAGHRNGVRYHSMSGLGVTVPGRLSMWPAWAWPARLGTVLVEFRPAGIIPTRSFRNPKLIKNSKVVPTFVTGYCTSQVLHPCRGGPDAADHSGLSRIGDGPHGGSVGFDRS
jgi:hypothetical protein